MLLVRDNVYDLIARFTEPLLEGRGRRVAAVGGQAFRAVCQSADGAKSRYVLNVPDADSGSALQQRLVGAAANEIKAAVSVLDNLDIRGCIVAADALNAQTKFARRAA